MGDKLYSGRVAMEVSLNSDCDDDEYKCKKVQVKDH